MVSIFKFSILAVMIAAIYKYISISTESRPPPEWFMDAKFGVMIHYGVYSVPAWAPLVDPNEQLTSPDLYCHNPYAAWYQNSMMIPNCSTYNYHLATYGRNVSYWDFKDEFDTQSEKLNVTEDWLNPIEASLAKYVVLVTKHHDGMTLWNSSRRSSKINIVDNYAKELSRTNLTLGLYYSGGFDWSFTNVSYTNYINSSSDAAQHIPQSNEYVAIVTNHYKYLIDTYKPKYLWNDIALPRGVDVKALLDYYYSVVPDGGINDRRSQSLGLLFINTLNEWALWFRRTFIEDFSIRSLEYAPSYPKTKYYWEADRGVGWDFSYNVNDFVNHTWSPKEAIDFIIMASANGGNLLLAVTPYANGSLPQNQIDVLKDIGSWLFVYGSTIFKTRPIFEKLSLHWTQYRSESNREWNVFIPCCSSTMTLLKVDMPNDIPKNFSINSLDNNCNFTEDISKVHIDLSCIVDGRSRYFNYSIPLTFKSI